MIGGVDAPDALRFGVGRYLGVHSGSARGRLDEPDAVDVCRAVLALLQGEQPGSGETVKVFGGNGGDDGNFRTGVEQSPGAAFRDGAAAHHQHRAAEQPQRGGVNVLYCHEKTVGRLRNMLQRLGNTR